MLSTKHSLFYSLSCFAFLIVLASAGFEDMTKQVNSISTVLHSTGDIKESWFSTRSLSGVDSIAIASSISKEGFTRLWSNATQWPNQVVPLHGADVEVPANWTLKLDVSSANLSTLHGKGDLFFDNTIDGLVITAESIWVEGQLFIGTSEKDRFTRNAKIRLTGNRKSKSLIIGDVQDVSNKVLAVTGNVTMFGALVNNVFVKLQAPAKIGAISITVPHNVGWKVGDQIVIGPSQRAYNESEVRTISAIKKGVITLNSSLEFYHFGATSVTMSTTIGDIDMRAEVGLLTRNIVVEGTEEDLWGGRIYVGEIYDARSDYYLRGRVNLDGIQMVNVGQANTTLAGLTFERLVSPNNDDSVIRRCAITNSLGYQIKVIGSTGITFENHLLFRSYGIKVKFEDENANILFKNNLLLHNEDRELKLRKGDMAFDFGATFYSDSKFVKSEISGNIISGCSQQCWLTLGGDCTAQEHGPYTIFNNTAHSGQVGWLVKEPSQQCHAITHFTGFKLEQGIATMFQSKNLRSSNLIITDTEIGISLNLGGVFGSTTISLTNSYVAGITQTLDLDGYTNKAECSNLTGILIPVSVNNPKCVPSSPSELPWYKVTSGHIWQSTFTMSGVTFENFHDTLVLGCENNFAIRNNRYASDACASTMMSNMTLFNVAEKNKIFFEEPYNETIHKRIGILDCHGSECTGTSNIIVRDLDGSFTGVNKPASIIPANNSGLELHNCTYSENENADICIDNGWGLLTLESLDSDVLTGTLTDVLIESSTSDYFSVLNNEKKYSDTELNRYPRFQALVQTNQKYWVWFAGIHHPKALRWGLQGALPSEHVTFWYRYHNTELSIKVFDKSGNVIKPKIFSLFRDSEIRASDPCGTNTYDFYNSGIQLKLTGEEDCRLSVAITNSIKASIRFELHIDNFFDEDGPTTFVDKLADFLKISPTLITVFFVNDEGWQVARVFFFIDSSHQENTDISKIAAKAELEFMISQLNTAQANGQLQALFTSKILDSVFDLNSWYPTPKTRLATAITISYIFIGIGAFALAVRSCFALRKCIKSKTPNYAVLHNEMNSRKTLLLHHQRILLDQAYDLIVWLVLHRIQNWISLQLWRPKSEKSETFFLCNFCKLRFYIWKNLKFYKN